MEFSALRADRHESEQASGTRAPTRLGRTAQLLDGRGVKLEAGRCTGPSRYGFDGRLVSPCHAQVE